MEPNIVIDGVDEFGSPGSEFHIGRVVIAVDSPRGRARLMTTR